MAWLLISLKNRSIQKGMFFPPHHQHFTWPASVPFCSASLPVMLDEWSGLQSKTNISTCCLDLFLSSHSKTLLLTIFSFLYSIVNFPLLLIITIDTQICCNIFAKNLSFEPTSLYTPESFLSSAIRQNLKVLSILAFSIVLSPILSQNHS